MEQEQGPARAGRRRRSGARAARGARAGGGGGEEEEGKPHANARRGAEGEGEGEGDEEAATVAQPPGDLPALNLRASPTAAGQAKHSQSAKTRRRKIAHVRAKTADSGTIGRGLAESSADLVSLGLSADGAQRDHGGSRSPNVRTRVRRVASEPRVVTDLDLTQRGLAKLESTDYTEVYLTSDDEADGNGNGGNCSEGSEDARSVVTGDVDPGAANDADTASPFSMRWKKTKRSTGAAARKIRRGKRRKDEPVQHSYFVDDKGEVRDEYGFKVEDSEPKYLCTPRHAHRTHASVPHDAKKRILSKEALKRRQRRVWAEVVDDFGGSLANIPAGALERWRKYYASERPDDSADRYLLQISSPLPSSSSSAAPPEGFSSPLAGPGHKSQHSLGSASQESANGDPDKDSPRRGSGTKSRSSFGHHMESVVRKLRLRKKRHDRGEDTSDDGALVDGLAMGQSEPAVPSRRGSASLYAGQTSDQMQSPHAGSVADPSAAAVAAEGASTSRIRHVTSAIRHFGVPPRYRREMWLMCSGALDKQRNSGPTEQYEYLVACATSGDHSPEMGEIIERDLHRTFPTNYHFENEEGITRMRRVLLAYSLRNQAIGYCQSMNFLVAVLLLHMDENLAFWVLASIVEDLVPGHYTKQMTGMHVDQRVFESLVKQKLPKLYAHLEAFEFPLEFVTYQWFLCLFVNSLPLETTLRIWDCFLHEGVKALFRAGLAILMILQKDIVSCDSFQDIYACISLADNLDRKSQLTGDRVLKLAYDSIVFRSFPSSRIAQLRSQHLPDVLGNLGQQADWADFTSGQDSKGEVASPQRHAYNEEEEVGEEDGDGEDDPEQAGVNLDLRGEEEDKEDYGAGSAPLANMYAAPKQTEAAADGKALPPPLFVGESKDDRASIADGSLSSAPDSGSQDDETRVSHARSEGTLPREDSMNNLQSDHPIRNTSSGSLRDVPKLRRKVSRRPSTSFKYELGMPEDPLQALSQLGIRSHRSVSLSSSPRRDPNMLDVPDGHRRASTNSPVIPPSQRRSSALNLLALFSPRPSSAGASAGRSKQTGSAMAANGTGANRRNDGRQNPGEIAELEAGEGAFEAAASEAAEDDSLLGRLLGRGLTSTAAYGHRAGSMETEFDDDDDDGSDGDGGNNGGDDDDISNSISRKRTGSGNGGQVDDDDDDDEDDEEEDGSDLPSEFSELLPSLAYVMSARQVNLDEHELTRAASSMADDSRKSQALNRSGQESAPGSALHSPSAATTPRNGDTVGRPTTRRRPATAPAPGSASQVRRNGASVAGDDEDYSDEAYPWADDDGIRVSAGNGEASTVHSNGSNHVDYFADNAGIRVRGDDAGYSASATRARRGSASKSGMPSGARHENILEKVSSPVSAPSNSSSSSATAANGAHGKKKRGLLARIGWQQNRKSL